MELEIGSICDGKVTAITKYGAFIALPEGKTGMVPISEVAHSDVNDLSEHLTEGQELSVKVIGIDKEGKVSLSIKKTKERAKTREAFSASNSKQSVQREAAPPSFEDKLKQFMSDSESRMSDLKQHIDKRSGSRRGRSR